MSDSRIPSDTMSEFNDTTENLRRLNVELTEAQEDLVAMADLPEHAQREARQRVESYRRAIDDEEAYLLELAGD